MIGNMKYVVLGSRFRIGTMDCWGPDCESEPWITRIANRHQDNQDSHMVRIRNPDLDNSFLVPIHMVRIRNPDLDNSFLVPIANRNHGLLGSRLRIGTMDNQDCESAPWKWQESWRLTPFPFPESNQILRALPVERLNDCFSPIPYYSTR